MTYDRLVQLAYIGGLEMWSDAISKARNGNSDLVEFRKWNDIDEIKKMSISTSKADQVTFLELASIGVLSMYSISRGGMEEDNNTLTELVESSYFMEAEEISKLLEEVRK